MSENTSPNAVISTPISKSKRAQALFDQCYQMQPVPQRKEIIARAIQEVGLTHAGASTYLQTYRERKGMVNKRDSNMKM